MTSRVLPTAAEIDAMSDARSAVRDDAPVSAPVVWLIGKVQSGKTSIIQAVTGNSEAVVGTGFKACTRTSRVYDFPPEAPILRFLDTRGLGETAYDPSEDLRFAENQAHLILVTMRAMDMAQALVVDVVAKVRERHPEWPVLVAHTTLHEGYAHGSGHVLPYPFDIEDSRSGSSVDLPSDLLRCLRHQREMMGSVPGTGPILHVPIDFTQPTDGLAPQHYGIDALADGLIRIAPAAMRAALMALPAVSTDERARLAEPIIMGHAMGAAGSDLVPIAGGVAASAVQAKLLHRLGTIYGVTWDRRTLAELATALGSGVAARTLLSLGVRQLAKLIPVYGQTVAAAASAATSFAVTYALGKAAVHFMTQRRRGLETSSTADAYQAALRHALRIARERNLQQSER